MSDKSELTPKEHETKQLSELTNVDFLIWLMDFSPSGVLGQAVIMTAIDAYAKYSLEHNTCPNEALINPAAWRRAAQHISNSFDRRNGVNREEEVTPKAQ